MRGNKTPIRCYCFWIRISSVFTLTVIGMVNRIRILLKYTYFLPNSAVPDIVKSIYFSCESLRYFPQGNAASCLSVVLFCKGFISCWLSVVRWKFKYYCGNNNRKKGNVLVNDRNWESEPFFSPSQPLPPLVCLFLLFQDRVCLSVCTALAVLELRVRVRGLKFRDPLVSFSPYKPLFYGNYSP